MARAGRERPEKRHGPSAFVSHGPRGRPAGPCTAHCAAPGPPSGHGRRRALLFSELRALHSPQCTLHSRLCRGQPQAGAPARWPESGGRPSPPTRSRRQAASAPAAAPAGRARSAGTCGARRSRRRPGWPRAARPRCRPRASSPRGGARRTARRARGATPVWSGRRLTSTTRPQVSAGRCGECGVSAGTRSSSPSRIDLLASPAVLQVLERHVAA